MRTESKTHKKVRELVAKTVGGKNNDHLHRSLNEYCPDVTTKEADYEIEVLSKSSHIRGKVKRWKNGKKKILIVAVDEEITELFDDVAFYKCSKFL